MCCRLCEWAFALGGFAAQYRNIDELIEAQRKNQDGTLTDEWSEVLKNLIAYVNEGKISVKLRGSKRRKIMTNLADARKRIVEVVQSSGTRVREKFRAVQLTKWQQFHPDSDPVADGHIIQDVNLPRIGVTKCVLMRHLPPGQYDVEVDTDLRSLIREEHDAGDARLRQGQEQAVYNMLQGLPVIFSSELC